MKDTADYINLEAILTRIAVALERIATALEPSDENKKEINLNFYDLLNGIEEHLEQVAYKQK